MNTDREVTRVVRSWLEEGITVLPDRVLDTVLDQLPATPQRRAPWPARRDFNVNRLPRAALAAAAIIVVAFVGWRLLPSSPSVGGVSTPAVTPAPTASPAPTSPATTAASPRPTVIPALPPEGPLAIGRHSLTLEGVHFTFAIANPGWVSNGLFGFDKQPIPAPAGAAFIVWELDADGIFADPCQEVKAPKAGPSAADMAAAIAAVPGTELVSGPTALTIGGKPAQEVIIRIPDVIPCPPDQFYLWYDDSLRDNARYATAPGSTIRIWIIEVDGKRVELDGETYAGAAPAAGAELEAIVRSITFE